MSTTPPSNPPQQLTVESIVAAPVAESALATVSVELESKQADLEKLKLLNHELSENIAGRGEWGKRVFWLLLGWLIAVLAVVAFQGFAFKGFHLDNSVLIAFIGTTTVDVLSLGYIVANYLFPRNK